MRLPPISLPSRLVLATVQDAEEEEGMLAIVSSPDSCICYVERRVLRWLVQVVIVVVVKNAKLSFTLAIDGDAEYLLIDEQL